MSELQLTFKFFVISIDIMKILIIMTIFIEIKSEKKYQMIK